jgi:hypothetical protein
MLKRLDHKISILRGIADRKVLDYSLITNKFSFYQIFYMML